MKLFLTLAALTCMVEVAQVYGQTFVKAQADLTLNDCLCQCSAQSFTISRGRNRGVYGNCQRADDTGADWCYLEPLSTTIAKAQAQCGRYRGRNNYNNNNNGGNTAFAQAPQSTTCPRGDWKESTRYRGTLYSYHACHTPRLTSQVCRQVIARAICGGFSNNNNNNFNNNNNNFNNNNNNGYNPGQGFNIGGRIAGDEEESVPETGSNSGVVFGGSASIPSDIVDDDGSDAVIF